MTKNHITDEDLDLFLLIKNSTAISIKIAGYTEKHLFIVEDLYEKGFIQEYQVNPIDRYLFIKKYY